MPGRRSPRRSSESALETQTRSTFRGALDGATPTPSPADTPALLPDWASSRYIAYAEEHFVVNRDVKEIYAVRRGWHTEGHFILSHIPIPSTIMAHYLFRKGTKRVHMQTLMVPRYPDYQQESLWSQGWLGDYYLEPRLIGQPVGFRIYCDEQNPMKEYDRADQDGRFRWSDMNRGDVVVMRYAYYAGDEAYSDLRDPLVHWKMDRFVRQTVYPYTALNRIHNYGTLSREGEGQLVDRGSGMFAPPIAPSSTKSLIVLPGKGVEVAYRSTVYGFNRCTLELYIQTMADDYGNIVMLPSPSAPPTYSFLSLDVLGGSLIARGSGPALSVSIPIEQRIPLKVVATVDYKCRTSGSPTDARITLSVNGETAMTTATVDHAYRFGGLDIGIEIPTAPALVVDDVKLYAPSDGVWC